MKSLRENGRTNRATFTLLSGDEALVLSRNAYLYGRISLPHLHPPTLVHEQRSADASVEEPPVSEMWHLRKKKKKAEGELERSKKYGGGAVKRQKCAGAGTGEGRGGGEGSNLSGSEEAG